MWFCLGSWRGVGRASISRAQRLRSAWTWGLAISGSIALAGRGTTSLSAVAATVLLSGTPLLSVQTDAEVPFELYQHHLIVTKGAIGPLNGRSLLIDTRPCGHGILSPNAVVADLTPSTTYENQAENLTISRSRRLRQIRGVSWRWGQVRDSESQQAGPAAAQPEPPVHASRAADVIAADGQLLDRILTWLPDDKRPTVPVRFVDPREMGKTSDPGAFTLDGVPMIYVSNQTAAYELARKGERYAQAVLASCIWHEEQHVRGRGEQDAYDAQIELVTLFIRTNRITSARGEELLRTLRELRARVKMKTDRQGAGADVRQASTPDFALSVALRSRLYAQILTGSRA